MALADSESSPGELSGYLGAVEAALRRQDIGAAMRLSDEAVAAGAEHPTVLALAGLRRMGAGDDAGALPLLQRARELAPRHVGVLDGLGQCLTRLGRPREALALFDAALGSAPDARLYFNKAMALEDLSELNAARTAYERAVALKPTHSEALARLAILAAQRGDGHAAGDLAARALAIDPRDAVARLALAMRAVEEKDFAAGETQIRALKQDVKLSPVNRALMHGLAGDILDGRDRTAEAFEAYTAAKAVLRAAYAPTMAAAGETMRSRETRLAHYFRRAERAAWRNSVPANTAAFSHVFLVGFPRSGTTLLEQVLASHPEVETMEERACLADSAAEFFGSDSDLDRLAALSEAELAPWREAYWRGVAEAGLKPARAVFIDKLPLYAVFLPLIAKLFPAAKILLALRDPRDVVLSCFRRRFAMNAGMYEFTTLDGAAAYYEAVMELIGVYEESLALAIRPTRHEDLIADFDGQTRLLCEFLGLSFAEEMRGFARRARARNIDTPSSAQVAQGLSAGGLAQWRRYREQLAPILPVLAPFVARFGYPET